MYKSKRVCVQKNVFATITLCEFLSVSLAA